MSKTKEGTPPQQPLINDKHRRIQTMRFEYCKKYHGTTYVYNSDNHILYTRDDSIGQVEYARHHFSEHQAVRLLTDILSGTVHPLDDYIRATTIEALPKCLKGAKK